MSMHIACSGFTSEQRAKILTNTKDEVELSNYEDFLRIGKEKDKNKFKRVFRPVSSTPGAGQRFTNDRFSFQELPMAVPRIFEQLE